MFKIGIRKCRIYYIKVRITNYLLKQHGIVFKEDDSDMDMTKLPEIAIAVLPEYRGKGLGQS